MLWFQKFHLSIQFPAYSISPAQYNLFIFINLTKSSRIHAGSDKLCQLQIWLGPLLTGCSSKTSADPDRTEPGSLLLRPNQSCSIKFWFNLAESNLVQSRLKLKLGQFQFGSSPNLTYFSLDQTCFGPTSNMKRLSPVSY